MEVLSKHLKHFQSSSDEDSVDRKDAKMPTIVLYREAIEHCSRIYRVMVCMFLLVNPLVIYIWHFRICLEEMHFYLEPKEVVESPS